MKINLKVNIGDRIFIIPKMETEGSGDKSEFSARFFEVKDGCLSDERLLVIHGISSEEVGNIVECFIRGECPPLITPYLESTKI